MTSAGSRKYWFRAKRYGWGWGLPSAWQGWAVLVAYLGLVWGGIPFVRASNGNFVYAVYVGVLTAVLVLICWLTGEPPWWRWGGPDS